MTRQLDLEQLLDIWLDDGPTDTADAVFDKAVARVYRQRQRPAWRVSWRNALVTTNLKLLIAAAAVIVVAVGGIALLGRPSTSPGGNPSVQPSVSPQASPSPSPSTAPSASAVFPAWWTSDGPPEGVGILPSGSHTTRLFRPGFTFSVPEGWVNDGDSANFFSLFPDTPANEAEFAASGDLADAIHMGPNNDPYFTCDAWEHNQGATAAEIVAAVVANDALATSEPIDVTIGGLTGKQIDVRLDPAWTESCPGDPPGYDLGDVRTRTILLDTPGRGVIVILVGSLHSAGHDTFLAEAMPIIESFQFDLGPEASPS